MPSRRSYSTKFWLVALWSLPLGAIVYKVYLLAQVSRMLDCDLCLAWGVLPYEVNGLVLLLALFFASRSIQTEALRSWLQLAWAFCALVLLADAVILGQFMVRLNWTQVWKFSGELGVGLKMVTSQWSNGIFLAVILGIWCIAVWRVMQYHPARLVTKFESTLLFVVVGISVVWPEPTPQFHTPYLRSAIFSFWKTPGYRTPYVGTAEGSYPRDRCADGLGRRGSWVIVVVESLSSFQSKAWGGTRHWTPELDRWSQRGLKLDRFYANGPTTEDGLVSMLTGRVPLPTFGSGSFLEHYSHLPNTLPKVMAQAGLHSAFLTTGDLRFLKKGQWLTNVGFNEVEGHEHPFYKGWPRFHFNAAPDEALYKRALKWMEERDPSKPFLLVLETVSTHQPYLDPDAGTPSMEGAFRYADRQLGWFLDELDRAGFFRDQGHVLITGDHRAMVPLTASELRDPEPGAFNRIPLLVIGPLAPTKTVSEGFSQTDIVPSLSNWVGRGQVCSSADQGLILGNPYRAPACMWLRPPYDLDLVSISCGLEQWTLELDGDRSRWRGRAGPDPLRMKTKVLRQSVQAP